VGDDAVHGTIAQGSGGIAKIKSLRGIKMYGRGVVCGNWHKFLSKGYLRGHDASDRFALMHLQETVAGDIDPKALAQAHSTFDYRRTPKQRYKY